MMKMSVPTHLKRISGRIWFQPRWQLPKSQMVMLDDDRMDYYSDDFTKMSNDNCPMMKPFQAHFRMRKWMEEGKEERNGEDGRGEMN